MRPRSDSLLRSKGGQMPFALIAVTLLLLASAYGAVCASIERSDGNAESVADEMEAMDRMIGETKLEIEAGIAGIVSELSRGGEGGTLPERLEEFGPMFDTWVEKSFPMRDRGVTAMCQGHDVKLGVETMAVSAGDPLADARAPCFLKAVGTVDVSFASSTASANRRLEISADCASGLPLTVGCATEFELSASGGCSALTQMLDYQLTALAQQRVLSGYGAINQYGGFSTDAILTEEDVLQAYRISMSILEAMCFRASDDGRLLEAERVDAADLLAAGDGTITVDVSAILAQTLAAMADRLVCQWVDYFMGQVLLDVVDWAADAVRSAVTSFVCFLQGKPVPDAGDYLAEALEAQGLEEEDYRYLDLGKKATVHVNGRTVEVAVEDGKTKSVDIQGFDVEVPFPESDLREWDGWDGFVSSYHAKRNDITEALKKLMDSVCLEVAGLVGKGTVSVKADAFDGDTFSKELSEALRTALNTQGSMMRHAIDGTVRGAEITDPMFGAIYERAEEEKDEIYGIGTFRADIETAVRAAVAEKLEAAGIEDQAVEDGMVAEAMEEKAVDDAVEEYGKDVDARLESLEGALKSVPGREGSLIKSVIVWVVNAGLTALNLFPAVERRMETLCQDAMRYCDTFSRSGIVELGGADSYELYDGHGNRCSELMDLLIEDEVEVDVVPPCMNDGNTHFVGFSEDSLAAYSSKFTVRLTSDVQYRAESSDAVLKALETCDSTASGSFRIDTEFDVPCLSGWPLMGVEYEPSTNFLDDAWNLIVQAMQPLIGPLMDLLGLVQDAADLCTAAIVEAARYAADLVMRLYEAVEEPIADIAEFIQNGAEAVVDGMLVKLNATPSKQTVSFAYGGLELTVALNAASLAKQTKDIVKVTLAKKEGDTTFSAYVHVKQKSSGPVILAGGSASSGDWAFDVKADPLMAAGPTLATVSGRVRGVEFDMTMPELVQYQKLEAKLSDVPGLDKVLGSIPLPVPGFKGSVDMGLELKYGLPLLPCLVINEFESNPEGGDAGAEWAELYNGGGAFVDLKGYSLVPSTGEGKAVVLDGPTVAPHSRAVVEFPKQSLNNSKGAKGAGEQLTLLDPDGNAVDRTPWREDGANDGRTWQRDVDAYASWTFAEGTKGEANGDGPFKGSALVEAAVVDIIKKSCKEAFDELGGAIKSVDELGEFLRAAVQSAIDEIIGMIAGAVVSASVFLTVEAQDLAETQHYGLRVAVELESEIVRDSLEWLIGRIGVLSEYLGGSVGPDPEAILFEDVYLTATAYAGIGAPEFLHIGEIPTVKAGVRTGVNLAAVSGLLGEDRGQWRATVGVLLEDVPSEALPPRLHADPSMRSDLWLLRAELRGCGARCDLILYQEGVGPGMAERTYRIPTVLSAEELMDKAFSRASKVSVSGTNALDSKKKTALAKVTAAGDIVKDTLDGYVRRFPRIEREEDFFPELVDLVVGLDGYKKSLGALRWASARTEKLKNEALRSIRRSKDPGVIDSVRSGYYGRQSSVIRQISSDLAFLQDAKNKFRTLPSISADVPTAVVAGFPNVGKSRAVAALSSATPEVAPYPFTTKGIVIGHMEDGWRRYQVIDTPGLLDRELGKRNDIEKQAVLALKYLTHVILFMLDPTETCGYSVEKQEALLASVREGFPGVPLIVAESKSDLGARESGNLRFSAETGEGMDALRAAVVDELRKACAAGDGEPRCRPRWRSAARWPRTSRTSPPRTTPATRWPGGPRAGGRTRRPGWRYRRPRTWRPASRSS